MDKLREWDQEKLLATRKLLEGIPETPNRKIISDRTKELLRLREVAPPSPPEKPITQLGDLWILGDHRLLCGDSADPDAIRKLVGDEIGVLVATDPPYGVDFGTANHNPTAKDWGQIIGDTLQGSELRAWLANVIRLWLPYTSKDSVWYVWGASLAEGHRFYEAILDAGLHVQSQIVWAKNVFAMGQADYQWKHEPCQPPGTLVRKVLNPRQTEQGRQGAFSVTKDVPIETLNDGDLVVSYDPKSHLIKMRGRPIRVGKRSYRGDLYTVSTPNNTTRATDGHQFTVRFSNEAVDKWCVYLMRRGWWWRVGITKAFNSLGFGPKTRLRQESGDEVWVLTTSETKTEALCLEQVLSVKYGIPTTCWNGELRQSSGTVRTVEMVTGIYEMLDAETLEAGAYRLLQEYGRKPEYPITDRFSGHIQLGVRSNTLVRACNLIAGLMEIPQPFGEGIDWVPIRSVDRAAYSGEVYSLDVSVDHHYIADGIVSHNCWYAFRKGENHRWFGGRDQTTVWTVAKDPNADYVHPTQKPIELFRRPMENHTRAGELCLEPFCGSGSQLIAAEQLGRRCYAMELDPRYVDVAVRRWEGYTRQKAERRPA